METKPEIIRNAATMIAFNTSQYRKKAKVKGGKTIGREQK